MKNLIIKTRRQKISKLVWLKINHGDDLQESLLNYCLNNNLKAGLIIAIGALKKARLSFYDQAKKKYLAKSLNQPLEILSGLGNVSLKGGRPFVHLHLTVSDKTGRTYGGHLEKGSVVFACECAILEASGRPLKRRLNELTGLNSWDFKD